MIFSDHPVYWKNKNGTSNRSCGCKTWKQHWINCSGKKWPDKCSVLNCSNKADLGAHVISTVDSKEKIIPMCKKCNNRTDQFELKAKTFFVDANKSESCEKL